MSKLYHPKSIASGLPVALAVLACLVFLGACGWQPFGATDREEPDWISSLVYDPRRQTQRSTRANEGRLPTNKAITLAPPPYSLPSPNPPLSLEAVNRCLLAKGIPSETMQAADPTHYDKREPFDAEGQPVANSPMLIVLHETVASEQDTINLFRTPQNNQAYQASYHMLIPEDGRRVRIVSDRYRAFGAGDSAFYNFTIRLKPNSLGSINNIALHLSLVSPADGRGDARTHSGYTAQQYHSAAAQVLLWQAIYGIPLARLTTHKAVDRSKTRTDPRSFDWKTFAKTHRQLATSCGLLAYASR